MTTGIERRIAALESRLEAQRKVPWYRDGELQARVLALLEAPVTGDVMADPDTWTDKAVARSRARQRLVAAFGQPVWLDGQWRLPQYRDGDAGRARVWDMPG